MNPRRNNWSLIVVGLLLAATFPATMRADLWRTEAELSARYGEPVEIRRELGRRTFTYQNDDLKLEIQFLAGLSQSVSYVHKDRSTPFGPEEIESLLKVNSKGKTWNRKDENTWELGVPPVKATLAEIETTNFSPDGKETRETDRRFIIETVAFEAKQTEDLMAPSSSRSRTGVERRFQGILEVKDEEDNQRVAIVRDGQTVLEIPWTWRNYPGKAKLEPGQTYEITLRDEDLVDLDASVAFVSDRVHKSHHDRVHDSDIFPIIRIKQAGEIVYDESVCEVHKIPMQRITAAVGYGMYAPASRADAVCDKNFPHRSDWIRGGCMLGEVDSAPYYICAECVAACAKYKREHPEEAAR